MGNSKPTKNHAVLNEEYMKTVFALALLVVGGVMGYFISNYINSETIREREYKIAQDYWINGYNKIGIEPALSKILLETLNKLNKLHLSELQLDPKSLRASDGTLVAKMLAPKIPPNNNNGSSVNCCEPLEIEGVYKYSPREKTLTIYDKRYCSVITAFDFKAFSLPDERNYLSQVLCLDEVLYDAEKASKATDKPL